MLASFIEKIQALALRGVSVEIETCDALPETVFIKEGDKYRTQQIGPGRRNHTVMGLADLDAVSADLLRDTDGPTPIVFYNHQEIVLLMDGADRRDTVTCEMLTSDMFDSILTLVEGRDFDVRSAIKFLRFELPGAADTLISALRRVDFTRSSMGSMTTEHGMESLGRQVESAVQQADQIPETFTVSVPVYANAGFRTISTMPFAVGVHIDLDRESVCFQLLADQLVMAITAAQSQVGAALRTTMPDILVFNGCP